VFRELKTVQATFRRDIGYEICDLSITTAGGSRLVLFLLIASPFKVEGEGVSLP
jgi:hypothetical protein